VVVYPNDHRPAHVHVIGTGHEVVFNRKCPAGPAELREDYGLSQREIGRIGSTLIHPVTELCTAWESIRGNL
jgi:hypothetical protein